MWINNKGINYGDKIKCIKECDGLTIGVLYNVLSVNWDSVMVENDLGQAYIYDINLFEVDEDD